MTKDKFDVQFLATKVCIRHNTYDEWERITQYIEIEFGIKLTRAAVQSHDWEEFPYTYIRGSNRVSNIHAPGDMVPIAFDDFWAIVTGEASDDICCSLEDVL